MDPGSTYNDMQREDADRLQVSRIVQRLTAQLAARGMAVASDQQFVDQLDAITADKRLTDDATELSVCQACGEHINYMLIAKLAEALVLMRGIRQRSSALYARVIQQQLRRHFIATLQSQDRWREPWITILNQELPGPPAFPLPLLVIRAKQRLTDRQSARHTAHLDAIDGQLATFLEIRGVELYPRDRATVTMLARELIQSGLLNGRKADGPFIITASELISRTSRPEHPAWNQLLQTYFL